MAAPPIGGIDRATRVAILDLQRRVAVLEAATPGGSGTYNSEASMSLEIATPVVAEHHLWVAGFDCTVARIRGIRTGGTGLTLNVLVGSVYTNSVDLSLSTAGSWTSAAADLTVDVTAGDIIKVEVVSITGTPTNVIVQVDFSA